MRRNDPGNNPVRTIDDDRAGDGGGDELLPVTRIEDIEPLPEGERWLVEGFLSRESITVLAAAPKTGKTWVALGLAVGVASGTPALGYFHVPTPGPVLVFPAEDDPRSVRDRVVGLCHGAGLELAGLPIDIITADRLLLDDAADRAKLERVIEARRPRLVVLDPLVRLHSGAESYVGHVAELFGYLRVLQRRFGLAVLVTHHLAKNRGRTAQPGSAMRGSGEIHAAYDHGAALEREKDGRVVLTLEHRVAESPEPVAFRLVSKVGDGTRFEFSELEEANVAPSRETLKPRQAPPLRERVLEVLTSSASPVSQSNVRRRLCVRNESLTAVLHGLQEEGVVEHLGRMKGWRIVCEAPQAPSETVQQEK
jgi:hypothetical protein